VTIVFALSTTNKLVLAFVAGAWIVLSLLVAMVIPRTRPDFPGKNLPGFLALSVVFFAGMLATVFVFAKEAKEGEARAEPALTQTGVTSTTSTEPATTGGAQPDLAAGRAAWDKAACGGCHVLAAAGGSGKVGPDLDELKPTEETVAHQVENGGGAMPAFKGILTPEEIQAVAAYVSSQAGKS
jgi:mono/diheme cytochrome c family protein